MTASPVVKTRRSPSELPFGPNEIIRHHKSVKQLAVPKYRHSYALWSTEFLLFHVSWRECPLCLEKPYGPTTSCVFATGTAAVLDLRNPAHTLEDFTRPAWEHIGETILLPGGGVDQKLVYSPEFTDIAGTPTDRLMIISEIDVDDEATAGFGLGNLLALTMIQSFAAGCSAVVTTSLPMNIEPDEHGWDDACTKNGRRLEAIGFTHVRNHVYAMNLTDGTFEKHLDAWLRHFS